MVLDPSSCWVSSSELRQVRLSPQSPARSSFAELLDTSRQSRQTPGFPCQHRQQGPGQDKGDGRTTAGSHHKQNAARPPATQHRNSFFFFFFIST